MPFGRLMPLHSIRAHDIVNALYALHDQADDAARATFPVPEDLLGVLEYAGRHTSALRDTDSRRESARLRLLLIRHVRHLLDAHELKTIKHGKAVATWEELAPMMGVETRNGAMARLQRLEVAADRQPDELRSPETWRARKRQAESVAKRHTALLRAAVRFLSCRAELRTDPDIEEDLDEIQALLDTPDLTATQRASLAARLRLVLRSMRALAAETGQPATRTVQAARALQRLGALVME